MKKLDSENEMIKVQEFFYSNQLYFGISDKSLIGNYKFKEPSFYPK